MIEKNQKPKSPQEDFLSHAKSHNLELTFYLMNGLPLKGRIIAYDNFTLLIEKEQKQLLIFKHAISTISQ